MASTRAVARVATRKSGSVARRVKGPAAIIYEMHSQLYPHLYPSGEPSRSLLLPRKKRPNRDDSKAQTTRKGLKVNAPRIFNSLEEFKQVYKGERVEKDVKHTNKIEVYPSKHITSHRRCKDPISHVASSQIALLDPTGARTRLFAKTNPECARVGDILLVRQRTGDPFAGVCINIRRRGVDTAILLRGQLTRVGVEMWYKIYSPLVEGIEVVQRAAKRARRARLTYMRTVKHDRGSVENVVRVYLRQKAALGTADGKKKGLQGMGGSGGKKGNKRGKHRR